MAVVKPKIRGFVCVTAHPEGCAKHVSEQIDYIRSKGDLKGAKNVLVLGCSTGYGLASRIALAMGSSAKTLGVCFERPPARGKPGSAGWYNSVALERELEKAGVWGKTLNMDAFSHEAKAEVIRVIKEEMGGKVDLVVYSLASPRRNDPDTGEAHKSCLKPIGDVFRGKSLDTDKEEIIEVEIEPATEEDIANTVKVMGGEDWELWMKALTEANVLTEDCKTVAYTYIGPEVTWAIYKNGTIGRAKEDLERAAAAITAAGTQAYIAVNKALVTQASSAIPVVPLYNSILFKVMKEKGTHEGCIEQMWRLFAERMYDQGEMPVDEKGRIRVDDWEMETSVQDAVKAVWPQVTTENLHTHADFKMYQAEFLKLFGFGLEGVDYDAEVDLDWEFPGAKMQEA